MLVFILIFPKTAGESGESALYLKRFYTPVSSRVQKKDRKKGEFDSNKPGLSGVVSELSI